MQNKIHNYYKKDENRKLIVFVHGFATTSNYFINFYKEYLEDEYDLSTIELPGMGVNPDKLDNFNVEGYANYVIKTIEDNG